MHFSAAALVVSAAILSTLCPSEAKVQKGLAWGTNNHWAKKIAKGQISWYHHWQDGPVPEMPKGVHYVPMDWGPRYSNLWAQRKKWIAKHKPKYVLAFNEPDVNGQANLSPGAAASRFMKELQPLRKQGIQVSSPQIVYNTKWMDSFLKQLRAKGGDVDFMAIHYYGTWKDEKRLEKWITTIHKKYNKQIWLTEYGVTASSRGSAAQIRNFKNRVTAWMDSKSYVDRVAWLGCFAVNNPPDSFASAKNAMFTSSGGLNKMAYSYVYKRDASGSSGRHKARSTPGATRHGLQHHKRIMASGLDEFADLVRRNASDDSAAPTINGYPATTEEIDALFAAKDSDAPDEYDGPAEHCDEICKLRDAAMAEAGVGDDFDVDNN